MDDKDSELDFYNQKDEGNDREEGFNESIYFNG
jgi:hypothetical protein